MNAYADANPAKVPRVLRSADIDKLFKRSRGWFARDRTRKRLYAKGFPHPIERGQWSPLAVYNWMETGGANPDNVPPDIKPAPRRRKARSSRSGYAEA